MIPLFLNKFKTRSSGLRLLQAVLLPSLLVTGCSLFQGDKKDSMESGMVPFSQGEVTSTMKASLKETWAAVQKCAGALGMRIETLQYEPPMAVMTAWTATGKRMEVHLKKAGYEKTSIVIQMGPKGDELLERQFLAKLEMQL